MAASPWLKLRRWHMRRTTDNKMSPHAVCNAVPPQFHTPSKEEHAPTLEALAARPSLLTPLLLPGCDVV
eukprot:510127-Amphidinium_carterae.1